MASCRRGFGAIGFGLSGGDQKFWPIELWRMVALLRRSGHRRGPGSAGFNWEKKMTRSYCIGVALVRQLSFMANILIGASDPQYRKKRALPSHIAKLDPPLRFAPVPLECRPCATM